MGEKQEFQQLLNGVLSGRYSRRAVMSRAAALGLSAAAISSLSLAAKAAPGVTSVKLATLAQSTPVTGGTLKVGLQADPTALDPHTQSLTAIWHVVEHLYSTLVRVKPDLSVEPALAETIDISDDGVVYTFHLRANAMFSDGTTVTADDVVFTFTRLLDPQTASTSASDLSSVKGAAEFGAGTADSVEGLKAIDPATVEITLAAPDASFLSTITGSSCIVMSKAFVEANNNDVSQVAMGSGPFKLDEYIPNTSLKMSRNEHYWEEGLPYLDGLEMLIVPEDTARTTSVVQGTTDFIEYAPLRDVDTLKANDKLQLAGDANTNIRFVTFNMSREPFDKLEVRQAISAVVDRTPMIESAVFGHGTPVNVIFPPTYWAALQTEIPAPDIDKAKSLLATAGLPDGFKTSITSWSQYSFLSNAAVVLQEQLKQIGIDAELNLVENATMIADVHTNHNYDIGVTGTSGYIDPHSLMLNNFNSKSAGNAAAYANPKVDDLINQGMLETDPAKRATIYQEIQQILLDDLPWVNLFVANQFEAMKLDVQGYQHIPTGSNAFLRETWLQQS